MKRKIYKWIFLANIFLGICPGHLEALEKSTEQLWGEANEAYAANEYIKARTLYEEIMDKGNETGPLCYNLGNTCFRLGSLGWARYYFERAERLMPQDPDLKANLKYLISQLPFKETREGNRIQKILQSFSGWLGMKKWIIISGLSVCLLSVYLILGLRLTFFKESSAGASLGVGIFVIATLVLGGADYYFKTKRVSGVIVEKGVAKYSPSLQGASAFELEEGLFCDWIREERGWVFIRLDRERAGWVSAQHIRKIN